MKETYPEKLERITKIKVVGEYRTANHHTLLQCTICDNKFTATPKSKIGNFKRDGIEGCPSCTRLYRAKDAREANIKKIEEQFDIISDVSMHEFNNNYMLTVKNKDCGHTFTSKTGNLLHRNVVCRVCNDITKREKCLKHNEKQHKNALKYKDGYHKYKSLVRVQTEKTYRENIKEINPDNLPRGKSGIDGAHHLDHIVSVMVCYRRGIPPEVCSHKDNLRVIPWKQNAVKWMKPPKHVPKIMREYIN